MDPHLRSRERKILKTKPPSVKVKGRMDRVIASYIGGMNIADACAHNRVSEACHQNWRTQYPEYKARFDRAKQAKRDSVAGEHMPFGQEFRKRFLHFDTHRHHQQMIDTIEAIPPGRAGAIFMPPEHAKSSMCEDYITYRIAMDPNVRVLIVSKTQKHAQKMLGRIQYRLTDPNYVELQEAYGPFKDERRQGRPWTATHFTVVKQDSGERDYTVQAVGIGGQVYGTRSDLIVLDDIADPSNQTAAQIDDQLTWLQLVVRTRVGKHGKLLVVGTRITEDDIYKQLEDRNWFSEIVRMPAIIREPGTDGPDDPGESLWPEQWPPDDLISLRRDVMDARIWALSYQQAEIPAEGAQFPIDDLNNCRVERRVGHVPPNTRVVVGIDPSSTGFTAGVVVAVDPRTELRHIVDVWNIKNLMGDGGDRHAGMVQFICELCETYRAERVCIEVNNMQTLITSSLTLRNRLSQMGTAISPFRSGRGGSENDDLAISQMSVLFANQMVTIPSGGQTGELIRQFSVWRPGDKKLVRDIVKAFQFAEHAARWVLRSAKGQDNVADISFLPARLRARSG